MDILYFFTATLLLIRCLLFRFRGHLEDLDSAGSAIADFDRFDEYSVA